MGNGEWGIGNGELGMGNGEWGMGNGGLGMGDWVWVVAILYLKLQAAMVKHPQPTR